MSDPPLSTPPAARDGDITVTALYTSQAWKWGGFEGAELLATRRARDVFNATNLALGTARLLRRDLPSLRHSLVQRHAMFDQLLAESGCQQVLEVAAGLSRRGAATTRDPQIRYTEVDLPAMIDHKRALLERTEAGRSVAARPNLRLVAGDVLEADLAPLVGPGPVFVIAEGLMMYLPADDQRAVWQRAARLLRDRPGSALAFDLVPACEQPKPGRVGRTLDRLLRAFTKGKSFAFDDRTREDIGRDLRDCGFCSVATVEPASAPPAWELPFPDAHTQVLVFVCRVNRIDAPPAQK